MEPVQELDILLYRGDSFTHQLIWKDLTGTPIDLSDYSARMQVRRSLASSAFICEVTDLFNGQLVLGGKAGTIDIVLTPSETDIETEENVYDLEVTSPTGVVTTLVHGDFLVRQDITR